MTAEQRDGLSNDERSEQEIAARGQARVEALMRRLADTRVDSLRIDVPRVVSEEALVASAEAVGETDYALLAQAAEARTNDLENEILGAERDRLLQQRGHRSNFFRWAVVAISVVLLFNGGMFLWHMIASGGLPSDVVIISWMSTSIVEVLGLGYIIARSLFQSGGANGVFYSRSDRKAQTGSSGESGPGS